MLDERFVLLGALLSLAGSGRYAWSTVHGRTQQGAEQHETFVQHAGQYPG